MVDKIRKALDKLFPKEKKVIKNILQDIKNGEFEGYDIKKLKGRTDIYRIRKGKIRIIYKLNEENDIYLISIERRNDKTYNF